MRVFRSIEQLASLRGPVHLAIGIFDGVHRGHREVIGAATKGAAATDGSSVVVTFDPHPAVVLRPELAPAILMTTRTKTRFLESLGVDAVLLHPFNKKVAHCRARAFIDSLVAACDPLGQIAVGWDWTFGRDREGDTVMLRELGAQLGFAVTVIEPVREGSVTISSTAIRAAIRAGDIGLAGRLLGHRHCVTAEVCEGRKLGRQLGFPTANLHVEDAGILLPSNGVYAVRAVIVDCSHENEPLDGVANLGVRPTVDSDDVLHLEVHLFDFCGDLYGRELRVSFVERLRDEQRFDGIDALKAQIAADVDGARSVLAGAIG